MIKLFNILAIDDNTLILIVFLGVILLIGLIAFRQNYIHQLKVSLLMDIESNVFNKNGLISYLSRNKKLKDVILVLVYIDNLGYLYTNYSDKHYLLYTIVNQFLVDLDKKETVARVDFDKFIIVFENKDVNKIKEELEKIEKRLEELDLKNYGAYDYNIVFGVYKESYKDDIKLSITKIMVIPLYSTNRFNNIYHYTNEVDIGLEKYERMNASKEHALKTNSFIAYIDPYISFIEGKVYGGEVCLKWCDEFQNELFKQEEFLPLFNQSGFIIKYDLYLFEKVCEGVQALFYSNQKDLVLGMRLSKISLSKKNFYESIESIYRKYSINPSNIQLEIEESSLEYNFTVVLNNIQKFKTLGFKIALTSFGKKNATISTLLGIPYNAVKIDKYFFTNNLANERDFHVVGNMVDMLKKLYPIVICEGILNIATLDKLALISHDLVLQGLYFSILIPLAKLSDYANATSFRFNYTNKLNKVFKQIEEVEINQVETVKTVEVKQPTVVKQSQVVLEDNPNRPLFFTLSRYDVFDHLNEMQLNESEFPIRIDVNEKINEKMPDFFLVNGWCFAMMFDRSDIVFNFILRMDKDEAYRLSKLYSIQSASSVSGEHWYSLIIDRCFSSKREVYKIIDDCYKFTMNQSLGKSKISLINRPVKEEIDLEAKKEQELLLKKMNDNLAIIEKAAQDAENKYKEELNKYKEEHYTSFTITRKEIAQEALNQENPNIQVIERPKSPHLPMSLKYKDKTYAMLHGTDTGVIMIILLPNDYADKIAVRYPELCRAKFPKGNNWYYLPIDGAFKDKETVFNILSIAKEFVVSRLVNTAVKPKSVSKAPNKNNTSTKPSLKSKTKSPTKKR